MRAHHLHQRTNFVVMVHADFENAVVRIDRHARKRQRHTPMIVERRHGSMDLTNFQKHMAQGFLGRRLADGTRHRNDLRLRACPRGNPKLGQGLKHILDHDHRHFGIAECGQTMLGHHEKTCTGGHGAGYKIMPVELFALDGKKASPGFSERLSIEIPVMPPGRLPKACLPWLQPCRWMSRASHSFRALLKAGSKCCSNFRMIRERQGNIADNLPFFVPLACNDQCITRLHHGHGGEDRFTTITDFGRPGAAAMISERI